MRTVLQLTRHLNERPTIRPVAGVELRHFAGTGDIERWLELRRRAFARQKVGVGDWDSHDFEREFLHKPWWQAERMWFAEARSLVFPPSVVGTVTLAHRGEGDNVRPVVHWLAVLPSSRRHGVGRWLVSTLEGAVWDAGGRQVWLETHVAWAEAARLYESLGYEPVRPDDQPTIEP